MSQYVAFSDIKKSLKLQMSDMELIMKSNNNKNNPPPPHTHITMTHDVFYRIQLPITYLKYLLLVRHSDQYFVTRIFDNMTIFWVIINFRRYLYIKPCLPRVRFMTSNPPPPAAVTWPLDFLYYFNIRSTSMASQRAVYCVRNTTQKAFNAHFQIFL